MALTCPTDLDPAELRGEVRKMYSEVATAPDGDFHFHRGPAYAGEFLGYERALLDALPDEATASFAGVGNPHDIDAIGAGQTVLDIGCGAGMDLLLAATAVGPNGRAIGVDMTRAMLDRAEAAIRSTGLRHVEVREGDAQSLPVDDASVDVVISNGVLNLTPDKSRAFAEIFRVLMPGGRLLLADITVASELSEGIRRDIDLWTG